MTQLTEYYKIIQRFSSLDPGFNKYCGTGSITYQRRETVAMKDAAKATRVTMAMTTRMSAGATRTG